MRNGLLRSQLRAQRAHTHTHTHTHTQIIRTHAYTYTHSRTSSFSCKVWNGMAAYSGHPPPTNLTQTNRYTNTCRCYTDTNSCTQTVTTHTHTDTHTHTHTHTHKIFPNLCTCTRLNLLLNAVARPRNITVEAGAHSVTCVCLLVITSISILKYFRVVGRFEGKRIHHRSNCMATRKIPRKYIIPFSPTTHLPSFYTQPARQRGQKWKQSY